MVILNIPGFASVVRAGNSAFRLARLIPAFERALNTFNAVLTVHVPFYHLISEYGNPRAHSVITWCVALCFDIHACLYIPIVQELFGI